MVCNPGMRIKGIRNGRGRMRENGLPAVDWFLCFFDGNMRFWDFDFGLYYLRGLWYYKSMYTTSQNPSIMTHRMEY